MIMKDFLNKIKYNRLSEEEVFILELITDLEIIYHNKWVYYKKGTVPLFEYLLDDKRLYFSFTHIDSIITEKYKKLEYEPILVKLFSDYYGIGVRECMVMKDRLFYCNLL